MTASQNFKAVRNVHDYLVTSSSTDSLGHHVFQQLLLALLYGLLIRTIIRPRTASLHAGTYRTYAERVWSPCHCRSHMVPGNKTTESHLSKYQYRQEQSVFKR